jgi:hypothetical protein
MGLTLVEIVTDKHFSYWFVGLFLGWAVLGFGLLPRISYFKKSAAAAGHDMVCIVLFVYLAAFGGMCWFGDADWKDLSIYDRVYGNFPAMRHMSLAMFAGQWFDLISSSVIKELRRPEHIGHHAAAGFLVYLGLSYGEHGFLFYYAAFFIGCTEISSIPLTFVGIFRRSKPLQEAFGTFNEINRVTFAMLFLVIRCVYWPYVAYDFWVSTLFVFRKAHHTPDWVFFVWWFFNAALTLLQFYWGSLVIKGVIKKLRGDKSGRDAEDGYKSADAREPAYVNLLDA